MSLRRFLASGLTSIALLSCTVPVDTTPRTSIRISLIGETTHPVNISWTVHQYSGSRTLTLNNGAGNPWAVAYTDIPAARFGTVSVSVTNNMGNQVKMIGVPSIVSAFLGSNKVLDLGPIDLSTVLVGDIFEDNAGQLLYITEVQNTSLPHELTVKDSDNNFVPGNWRILSSNYSYIAAKVERGGKVVGSSSTFQTLIGDVSLSLGSLSW